MYKQEVIKIKAIVTKDTPDMLNPGDGLKAGEEVEVVAENGEWLQIKYNGGLNYVHKSRLKEKEVGN